MRLTIYHATCWVLGLMAFVQLVMVGAALAVRGDALQEPQIVEKVVTEYVSLPPKVVAAEPAPVVPLASGVEFEPFQGVYESEVEPSVTRSSLSERPAIKDPIVEVLVLEAREAKVAGDLGLAILKLEEAQKSSPEDPNLLYEFGEISELLRDFDKAADYYEQVFQQGVISAGVLYEQAAKKLSEGFGNDEYARAQVTLGRVREFHDQRVVNGEKIVLTIPILTAAGQIKDPNSVVPKVLLYDQVRDDLVLASETHPPESRWVSEPVDYRTGEEQLRVTYFIPKATPDEEQLFGARKYFGHVVELYVDGELVDQVAWPRTLAAKVNAPESDPLYLPEEYLPEDFNPDNPLLPSLPR